MPVDFDKPPVVETVLGVQFGVLPNLQNAHLGVFWKTLGEQWTKINDAPALEPQTERFDEAGQFGTEMSLFITQAPPLIRLMIRNRDANRMIQVQNGRLHYNWLGLGGQPYARYPAIRQEFDATWAKFQNFIQNESLGECQPNGWEVTYVNHIPRGTVWSDPSDWSNVVALLNNVPQFRTGLRFETCGGEWKFEIPPRQGRLHVSLKHGRQVPSDGQELLVLTLTARGTIDRGSGMTIENGLDLGRETIVQAFRDLTTSAAHSVWGLKNA